MAAQWDEAVLTSKQLFPLVRSYDATMWMGPFLKNIPFFVVGSTGWQQLSTVEQHLNNTPEIRGILVIDPGIFASSAQFGGTKATGPWALWGLMTCLHQATSFLKAVSTNLLDYAI